MFVIYTNTNIHCLNTYKILVLFRRNVRHHKVTSGNISQVHPFVFHFISVFFNLIYTLHSTLSEKKQYELFVTVGLAYDIEHAYHEQGLKCHADSIIEEYPRV